MQVTYVSNTRFPWCTESEVTKALRKLGHGVINIQEDEISAHEFMRTALAGDLVLWTRTWDKLVTHDHLAQLRAAGIPTVALHADLYLGISREALMAGDPFWAVDRCFTADGDPECQEKFKSMGIEHRWLPPGVDDDECYISPEPYKRDLAFVGSWVGYHPEYEYRRELVQWLRTHYRQRFEVWGPQGKGSVRGKDLNSLYSSTKITIGDSLCLNFTHTNYWSDRIVNSLSRGAFLIHPRIKGLEDHYILDGPEKELVTYEYNNWDQLASLISYYFRNNDEREAIKKRGFIRTKRDHTWLSRISQMLDILRVEGLIK